MNMKSYCFSTPLSKSGYKLTFMHAEGLSCWPVAIFEVCLVSKSFANNAYLWKRCVYTKSRRQRRVRPKVKQQQRVQSFTSSCSTMLLQKNKEEKNKPRHVCKHHFKKGSCNCDEVVHNETRMYLYIQAQRAASSCNFHIHTSKL